MLCRWTNFLFINNFYPKEFSDGCMGWTWYLANDFQLYCIAPVFVYLYYKRPKIGAAAVAFAVFMSCIAGTQWQI